jgi:small subunit ribosomal protein S20
VRQNAKRRAVNRVRKSEVKTHIRRLEAAIKAGDAAAAQEQLKLVCRRLDKISSTSTMHKNTAARKKSRLAKRVNALSAKQPTKA